MKCQWKALLNILPGWIGEEIDPWGKDSLLELRLRLGSPVELVLMGGRRWLNRPAARADLEFCVNAASRYSPWAAATQAKGFLSSEGGHRIGLCGEAIYKAGEPAGIRDLTSVCVRVARDIPGVSGKAKVADTSVIIIGAPGWGKTTLLRDLIRRLSLNRTVAVVDERGELFPESFHRGTAVDVMAGISKADGIEMLVRTMNPDYVAVDEITQPKDCAAILQAKGCGVKLLATAHAGSLEEFAGRSIYRPLLENDVFQTALILDKDKSFRTERIGKWNTNG